MENRDFPRLLIFNTQIISITIFICDIVCTILMYVTIAFRVVTEAKNPLFIMYIIHYIMYIYIILYIYSIYTLHWFFKLIIACNGCWNNPCKLEKNMGEILLEMSKKTGRINNREMFNFCPVIHEKKLLGNERLVSKMLTALVSISNHP